MDVDFDDLDLGDIDLPPIVFEPGPEPGPRRPRPTPDPAVPWLTGWAVLAVASTGALPAGLALLARGGHEVLAWALLVGAGAFWMVGSWLGASLVARHRYAPSP